MYVLHFFFIKKSHCRTLAAAYITQKFQLISSFLSLHQFISGACSAGRTHTCTHDHTSPESICLDHYCPCHNIIHSSVVLEEEQCDKCREKKRNGEVFVQGSDG